MEKPNSYPCCCCCCCCCLFVCLFSILLPFPRSLPQTAVWR